MRCPGPPVAPVTIVSGATGEIGAAIAEHLDRSGHIVVGLSRNPPRGSSSRLRWMKGDVRCRQSCQQAIDAVVADHGRLDHAVLAAGILRNDPSDAGDQQVFYEQLDTNCSGALRMIDASADQLAKTRGSVVAISTALVGRNYPGRRDYIASKTALESHCRQLTVELGRRGVRVNVVRPGYIRSSIRHFAAARETEVAQELPLGRVGTPDDISGAVEFLLSDRATWITGAILCVDGGRSAT